MPLRIYLGGGGLKNHGLILVRGGLTDDGLILVGGSQSPWPNTGAGGGRWSYPGWQYTNSIIVIIVNVVTSCGLLSN